jgi:hypothetical protein
VWRFDTDTEAGIVDEATGTVTATRSFTTAGVCLVQLTVTSSSGASGTASQVDGLDAMVVIYDPDGGFVTGGGWIHSPAGAYLADPTLTGKANFGFVSKYKRGASVPTGETEFQFKAGNLNFHGDTYDWLVVAGHRAQYRGTGRINGAGSYGFMISAVDGDRLGNGRPDRFRIKIWDKSNADALVYDNQIGASDTASASTALGGGSIVIHGQGGGGQTKALADASGQIDGSPLEFALQPLAPNPFRGAVRARLDLPKPSSVRIAIYDALGRRVRDLVNGWFDSGRREWTWDGRDTGGDPVAPGTFFVRVEARATAGEGCLLATRKVVRIAAPSMPRE